jgi:hypothetical protein
MRPPSSKINAGGSRAQSTDRHANNQWKVDHSGRGGGGQLQITSIIAKSCLIACWALHCRSCGIIKEGLIANAYDWQESRAFLVLSMNLSILSRWLACGGSPGL